MKLIEKIKIYNAVFDAIRAYFKKTNCVEIQIPILSDSIPIEPTIYPFITDGKYLSTSPERALKILISKGIGDCFAFGKSFRNLETKSPIHLYEFTMLEWYRENTTSIDMILELKQLLLYVYSKVQRHFSFPETFDSDMGWEIFSLKELFETHLCVDYSKLLKGNNIFDFASGKNYQIDNDTTWEQLFHQLFLNEIYPHIQNTSFFLIDYPSRISPLCAPKTDNPLLAQRFEYFFKGMELANGNTENTDVNLMKRTFEDEIRERNKKYNIKMQSDQEFLDALTILHNSGISYAGVGLGIERLCMILSHSKDIQNPK